MTRIITVAEITENEAEELARRPGARPYVDTRLAEDVRERIAELRGTKPAELALGFVGEDTWLAYVLDESSAGSDIYRVTVREPSQFGAFP